MQEAALQRRWKYEDTQASEVFPVSFIQAFIQMSKTRPTNFIKSGMRKRLKEGKCLVCDCKDNKRRGLCQKHYGQFMQQRDSLSQRDALAFEKQMIESGKVLPPGGVRKFLNDSDNPFLQV